MKNVKHHYITESYQKNFANDKGMVWFLNENGKIFETNPNNVLKESHFYTMKGSLEVEKIIALVEGRFATVYYDKISKRLALNSSEKVIVSMFVALMLTRTKIHRETLDKFFQKVLDMGNAMREKVKNNPESKRYFIDHSVGSEKDSITMEEIEQVKSDMSSFQAHSTISNMVDFAGMIADMNWTFFVAPDSDVFICSDNPLHMCRPEAERKFGVNAIGSSAGLICTDTEITMPISSNVALFAGWKNSLPNEYLDITPEMVRQINHRTIRASKNILANNKRILEDICSKSKNEKA